MLNLGYRTSYMQCVTPPSKPVKFEAMDKDEGKKGVLS
jgi:hypothetical protein